MDDMSELQEGEIEVLKCEQPPLSALDLLATVATVQVRVDGRDSSLCLRSRVLSHLHGGL